MKDRIFNDIFNVQNEFFFKYDCRKFAYKIIDELFDDDLPQKQSALEEEISRGKDKVH